MDDEGVSRPRQAGAAGRWKTEPAIGLRTLAEGLLIFGPGYPFE